MTFLNTSKAGLTGLAALMLLGAPLAASADGGPYVGGSIGAATLDGGIDNTGIPQLPSSIDEDDTAYKVFLGYKFDLPVLDFAIEGGYVNLGEPEIPLTGLPGINEITFETTGLNIWGTAGIEVGPIDLFAKYGFISWDVEAGIAGFDSISDDGTDPAYGLGASFEIGSLQLRGEYEVYDFDGADVDMLSVGIAFRF